MCLRREKRLEEAKEAMQNLADQAQGLTKGQMQYFKRTGDLPLVQEIRVQAREDFEDARSWEELGESLKEKGLRVEQKRTGGIVRSVETGEAVALSSVDRSYSMGRLEERFDESFSEYRERRSDRKGPDRESSNQGTVHQESSHRETSDPKQSAGGHDAASQQKALRTEVGPGKEEQRLSPAAMDQFVRQVKAAREIRKARFHGDTKRVRQLERDYGEADALRKEVAETARELSEADRQRASRRLSKDQKVAIRWALRDDGMEDHFKDWPTQNSPGRHSAHQDHETPHRDQDHPDEPSGTGSEAGKETYRASSENALCYV